MNKPTEAELVAALSGLLQASQDLINDPCDFGPYTESCNRRYKGASQQASRVLRSYRKEANGRPQT